MTRRRRKASIFSLVERRPPIDKPWSPVELLEEFVAEIKAGKVKPDNLMVFFLESQPDGRQRPHVWSANVSRAEAIAFCQLETARSIEEWRRD